MSNAVCDQCQSEIGAGARTCARCGAPAFANFMPDPRRTSRRQAPSNAFVTWAAIGGALAIMAVLVGIGIFFGMQQRAASNREANALADTSRELLMQQQQRIKNGGAGRAPDGPAPGASTELAPARSEAELLRGLNVILREVGHKSQYRQAQIEAQMNALKIETVLEPKSLVSAGAIRNGRDIAARYTALLEQSVTASRESNDELTRRVRALASGLPAGKRQLGLFESSTAKRLALESSLIANQRRMMALIGQMLDLAQSGLGRIQLQDGSLAFQNQNDLDRYNQLADQIQATAADETRITREQQAMLRQAMTQVDRLKRS
ncbi:hypothetical protein [Pseudomonas sp. CGJS7]|uniref:hypothetical protein n=1 Tax=Pseudomonas sp. CGJS7 TaxID=3109348 RepID=UPI0030082274